MGSSKNSLKKGHIFFWKRCFFITANKKVSFPFSPGINQIHKASHPRFMEQIQSLVKIPEATLPSLRLLLFLPDNSQVHVLSTWGPIFFSYTIREIHPLLCTVVILYPRGIHFMTSQQMLETTDSTTPYVYYHISYIYIPNNKV